MPKDELAGLKENMDKAIAFLQNEYLSIRTGRAHPGLISDIKVDYYGTPTPIKNLANVTVSESRSLQVAPFDKTSLKAIEKAILAANVGMTPQSDGTVLRMTLPELTKILARKAEESKVVIRNYRRDTIEALKKQEKASEITEDDLKKFTKDVQDTTDKYIKKIDEVYKVKEKEVLED